MMKSKFVAAALLASCSAFAAETNPLGLQLWSLRNQMVASLPSGMAEVKVAGVHLVETAGTYSHTAKEMRALADANGLKIVGCHIPYERLQTDIDGAIAEAKTLGASYIIVAWVPHKTEFDVAQARAAVANFNAWGAKLKAAGLGFGFHTHGYEFRPLPDGTSAFDVMMKETDPEPGLLRDGRLLGRPGRDRPRQASPEIPGPLQGVPHQGYEEGSRHAASTRATRPSRTTWPSARAAGLAGDPRRGPKDGVKYYFIEDETADPVDNIPPSIAYLEALGLNP